MSFKRITAVAVLTFSFLIPEPAKLIVGSMILANYAEAASRSREQERIDNIRWERERLERERLEWERREKMRRDIISQERRDRERIDQLRWEQERRDQERLRWERENYEWERREKAYRDEEARRRKEAEKKKKYERRAGVAAGIIGALIIGSEIGKHNAKKKKR